MSYGNDYGGGGNYQTTSYGGGGGGGGGFMSGSQGGSQNSPSKSAQRNTLRPVTIKQIIDAEQPHTDGGFLIDGTELGQITFVAQIRNVTEQSTHNTYKMDDGTGTVEVKHWIGPDSGGVDMESGASNELVEGVYVRVLGSLKPFANKKNVGSHTIRPVTDFNEINYHFLDATAAHLLLTRGPPETATGIGATAGAGVKTEDSYGDVQMGNAGGAGGGGGLPASTSAAAKKVYATIRSNESNEGMHINAISQASGLNVGAVYKAVDELLGLGAAYTTLDDEHIACMEF